MSFMQQFQNYWTNLSSGEKLTIGISSTVVFVGLVFLFMWASAERYDTVFSAGDSAKVRSAAQALEEAGVEYKISEDGMRLMTTTENVGRARIITAGTTSIAGMEMLDSIQLGISPQHERWIYLNALQGELTRTISSLDEVGACRVHIVEPERNTFLNPSARASASVTVKLQPGQSLSSAQIRGITSLVAGAVKGLTAKDVVLIDETGRLLSGPKDDDAAGGGASTASESRQEHEMRLRGKIIAQLGQILGSTQHVSAAVTVDVVTESTEESIQDIDPKTQVTISEKINESSTESSKAGGVPGTESNLPEQANTAAKSGDSSEKFQAATNYEYKRTITRKVRPPGSLERVSASVLVNTFAIEALVAESNSGMTAEDLQKQIETAAQTAIGFDTERKDTITVSFVPFSKLEPMGELSSASVAVTAYLPYLVPVIGLILAFLLLRPIISAISNSVSGKGDGLDDLSTEEMIALQEKLGIDGNGMALANRLRKMVSNFEEVDAQELNRLIQMQDQPSAEVIRRWLRASS